MKVVTYLTLVMALITAQLLTHVFLAIVTPPRVVSVSFDGPIMWVVYSNGEVRFTDKRPHQDAFQRFECGPGRF